MSKSKKQVSEMNWQASSTMRWLSGEEVVAYLDWDESKYYLWFEPTSNFEDFCEEIERNDLLIGLQNDLDQIGVQELYDLNSVNEFCKRYCGSDDPYDCAEFYEDELVGICGA